MKKSFITSGPDQSGDSLPCALSKIPQDPPPQSGQGLLYEAVSELGKLNYSTTDLIYLISSMVKIELKWNCLSQFRGIRPQMYIEDLL